MRGREGWVGPSGCGEVGRGEHTRPTSPGEHSDLDPHHRGKPEKGWVVGGDVIRFPFCKQSPRLWLENGLREFKVGGGQPGWEVFLGVQE